jgi:hypothetical protein
MYLTLTHLLLALVWAAALLAGGHFLFKWFYPKLTLRVVAFAGAPGIWFLGYWLALVLVVCGTAIVFTTGKTVFWGLLPLLGLLKAWDRKLPILEASIHGRRASVRPALVGLAFLLVFALLWHFGGLIDPHSGRYVDGVLDTVFYAKIAKALSLGHETFAYDALLDASYGAYPYHFFEMWLGVAVSFGHTLVSPFVGYVVVATALLLFGLLLGIYTLAYSYGHNGLRSALLTLALFGGVAFAFMAQLPGLSILTDSSLAVVQTRSQLFGSHLCKAAPLVIWLLACWLLAQATRNLAAGLLLSGFLVFLNIAVLPWVCFAAFAWVVVLWKQPANVRRQKLLLSLWFMSGMLYMGVFYLLSSKIPVAEVVEMQKLPGMATRMLQFFAPTTAANILGKTFLQMALLFLPLLAVALLSGFWKAPYAKWVALATGVLYGISATFWAIFALIVPSDAVQFFTLSFFPAFIILCWVICLQLFQGGHKGWTKMAALGILLLWGLQLGQARVRFYLSNHSHTNSEAYAQALMAAPLERGIYVHNPKTQNGADWFSKHLRVAIPDYLIVKHATAWPPVPVRDLHIQLSTNPAMALAEDQMRRGLLFFRYFHKLKRAQPTISEDEALLRFVQDYRIDYALLAPGATLPPAVMALVTQRVQDSKSGQTLLLLRK